MASNYIYTHEDMLQSDDQYISVESETVFYSDGIFTQETLFEETIQDINVSNTLLLAHVLILYYAIIN